MNWDQREFERGLRRTFIGLCIVGVATVVGLVWFGFVLAEWMK